jgi:hypothetical protein
MKGSDTIFPHLDVEISGSRGKCHQDLLRENP